MSEIRGPRRSNNSVPQLLLQRLDLQRHRGLAERQFFGRLGDALGAGGVAKAAELLQAILLVASGRRGHLPVPAGEVTGQSVAPIDSIRTANNCLRQS